MAENPEEAFSGNGRDLELRGYGYRKITAELRNRDYSVNHKSMLRLMRQDNLFCLKKRFKPMTTDSSHGLPVS